MIEYKNKGILERKIIYRKKYRKLSENIIVRSIIGVECITYVKCKKNCPFGVSIMKKLIQAKDVFWKINKKIIKRFK